MNIIQTYKNINLSMSNNKKLISAAKYQPWDPEKKNYK